MSTGLRDVFVVVPDLDTEHAVKTLLTKRQDALEIRLNFDPVDVDLLRYAGRDSGCRFEAVQLLRAKQKSHRHGLLVFDRHGCGDARPREQIEQAIESLLVQNGWPHGNVAVIVIDPEIEAWVWSSSPNVAHRLGWPSDAELKAFLESKSLWATDALKPKDPKEALSQACRAKGVPVNARVFEDLAESVGLRTCQDSAFRKFQTTLKRWFGGGGRTGSAGGVRRE
jgi:hypothetical protein